MTKRTTYRQVLNLSSNICPFSSDMVTLRFLFKEACYSQIKSDDINKVTTVGCLTLELKVKVRFSLVPHTVHRGAKCPFIFRWGFGKPLLRIQGFTENKKCSPEKVLMSKMKSSI